MAEVLLFFSDTSTTRENEKKILQSRIYDLDAVPTWDKKKLQKNNEKRDPKVKVNLLLHSFGFPGKAGLHGLSWYPSLHFSQFSPAVLWVQLHLL